MKKLVAWFMFTIFAITIGIITAVVVESLTEPVARNDGMETIITAELRDVYREGYSRSLYGLTPDNPYPWTELAKRSAWFSGYMDHTEFIIIKTQNKQFNILLDEIKDPCGVP